MGLREKVALTLAESIKGRHHQLYFDNYFTSIKLLSKLLSEGMYGCGMMKTNRKQYPSKINVEAQRFQRGESVFHQSGNWLPHLGRTRWSVNVASTLADPSEVTFVSRRQKDDTRICVSCPLCVALYNQYMGGVDEADQLRGYYHVHFKYTKNYKYIFILRSPLM